MKGVGIHTDDLPSEYRFGAEGGVNIVPLLTLLLGTGNRRLVQLVNNLAEQMYRYRFEYIKDESQHERLYIFRETQIRIYHTPKP